EDRVGSITTDLPGRDDNYGWGRVNLLRSLCLLDTETPVILGPERIHVTSPSPAGIDGNDPAVAAAVANALTSDDLDPAPKVTGANPGHLSVGVPVPIVVTATDACGHASQRT